MPFHSTTIFTLAHLLHLSFAHLPQQKTPFKLAILYNDSIADAHPCFLLEEAILFSLLTSSQIPLDPYVSGRPWCVDGQTVPRDVQTFPLNLVDEVHTSLG